MDLVMLLIIREIGTLVAIKMGMRLMAFLVIRGILRKTSIISVTLTKVMIGMELED